MKLKLLVLAVVASVFVGCSSSDDSSTTSDSGDKLYYKSVILK